MLVQISVAVTLLSLFSYVALYKSLTQQSWWKYLSLALLSFVIIGGMLLPVPRLVILNETIRNLYFHVPMWFGMMVLLMVGAGYSIAYLNKGDIRYDNVASSANYVGLWFGCLGMVTGMLWAQYTWGEFWSNDPKQMASAIALLLYFAYFILRNSIDDDLAKAKVSAVYSILAFFSFFVLIYVMPRLVNTLHPGADGNPAFGDYDLDHWMKLVFYPAVAGWILLGYWMLSLKVRLNILSQTED